MPVAAKTRSPFLSDLTSLPTNSMSPASSCPRTGCLGLRMPNARRIGTQIQGAKSNLRSSQSAAPTVVARIRTSTSLSLGTGFRTALSRITSGGPESVHTIALIGLRLSLTVLHDDDDLASSVPLVCIPKGLSGLSQRIRSVDDRSDSSGLEQLLESDQVVLVRCRDERAFLLAHEQ